MKSYGRSLYLAAFAAVGVLGMTGSAAFAAPVYVGQVVLTQNGFSSQYGGEFTANLTYDPSAVGSVANQNLPFTGPNINTGSTATFETFCIEEGLHDVVFYPGNPYAASIGYTDGLPQTINTGAAYLFDQFWHGSLTGYNFLNTGTGLTRQQTAGALQAAIWVLEGDNTMDGTLGGTGSGAEGDAGITSNPVAIAQANAWIYAGQHATVNLIPPVQVLGLYGSYDPVSQTYTGLAQAQLVEIPGGGISAEPVPLPASAGVGFSMLGGFGIMYGLRKRMNRRARIA